MGNLSEITGLRDFVSGNNNDIGIHFLLMKDPTYNNLYNFMKGIVKSDSIGMIFNTFNSITRAMLISYKESEQQSSRSDSSPEIEIIPTTEDVASAAAAALKAFDGSGGGKRSKKLKRNIKTNKKRSNKKKRRTNNKRSKRNNKLTNHKRRK